MRLCAVTMVHNEPDNLPLWLSHYGAQVGPENLVVIDHGSTDETADLASAAASRIRLPREHYDNEQRVGFVRNLCTGLLRYYDAVLYSDADEFLVADPARYADLPAYLARTPGEAHYAVGLNIWHLRAGEPPLDPSRALLRQRRAAQFEVAMCKPLIGRTPLDWNAGFHSSQHRPALSGDLYLLHLKYADYDRAMARLRYTRAMPWSPLSIKGGQGRAQRRTDEELAAQFDSIERAFVQRGPAPFDFAPEIAAINEDSVCNAAGRWARPKRKSKLLDLPEGLRDVL